MNNQIEAHAFIIQQIDVLSSHYCIWFIKGWNRPHESVILSPAILLSLAILVRVLLQGDPLI